MIWLFFSRMYGMNDTPNEDPYICAAYDFPNQLSSNTHPRDKIDTYIKAPLSRVLWKYSTNWHTYTPRHVTSCSTKVTQPSRVQYYVVFLLIFFFLRHNEQQHTIWGDGERGVNIKCLCTCVCGWVGEGLSVYKVTKYTINVWEGECVCLACLSFHQPGHIHTHSHTLDVQFGIRQPRTTNIFFFFSF